MYTKEIDLVQAGSYYFLIYALTILCTRPFVGRLLMASGSHSLFLSKPCMLCDWDAPFLVRLAQI